MLNQIVNPIKNGFSARAVELGVVGHGLSAEMASRNLERVAVSLLAPFERDGTLRDELRLAGIEPEEDGPGLTVVVAR